MGRLPVGIKKVERQFLGCLASKSLGLGPTELVGAYTHLHGKSDKTGWNHLARLRKGLADGSVRRILTYTGPDGERFGDASDPGFLQRKADAETVPPDTPAAVWHLGGFYQGCPVRVSWEYCPVLNRLRQVAVVTVGVADFMRCHLCLRFHFMGLSPQMKHTRPQVWELDPAVCWRDYEDALTVELIADPETHKSRPTEIDRVRGGGRWIGLRYRISWDEDPYKRIYLMQWKERQKALGETTNVSVEG
jgi:hypothetical protein